MTDNIDPLVEWAVFGHLDSKKDLELLLLKGHLLLEAVLQSFLTRNNVPDIENYSFYKKIVALNSLKAKDEVKKDFIISMLKKVNLLRNKIAHEFHFNVKNGELEKWAFDILNNLQGTKYSKYTFRTKIAHGFSVLAINILEIEITI